LSVVESRSSRRSSASSCRIWIWWIFMGGSAPASTAYCI
jgi:hypothetical protein